MPSRLKGDKSEETYCYSIETSRTSPGITFHLPSRRRFIPYSWLLYAEMNEAQTEFDLHYTHSVVTITGSHLGLLHDYARNFQLSIVHEMQSSSDWPSITQIEIVENAPA